jgi:hypothetical protein
MSGPAYIGGEFRTEDNVPFLRGRGDADLHFPPRLRNAERACLETGSDALAAILAGLGSPARVWVPAHFCLDSVRRAQAKADRPWEARTYPGLDDLPGRVTPGEAILFLHFNAVDGPGAERVAALAAEAGASLIEDFAHAPLDIAGFRGAAAFNSLRKLACLEVAVAYCRGASLAGSDAESEYHRLKKEAAQAKDEHARRPDPELEGRYLALFREAEDALSRDGSIVAARASEAETFSRMDFAAIGAARRDNHDRLVARMAEAGIPLLPGSYAYAMGRFTGRDGLREWLFERGVFPAVHWRDCGTPLADEILGFHIDQRYGAADMDRLARLVAAYNSTHSSSP